MRNLKTNIRGVSGIFIYANDPEALARWYEKLLGIKFNYWEEHKSYGLEFIYSDHNIRHAVGTHSTVLAIHPLKKKSSASAEGRFKIQYRTDNLKKLTKQLTSKGITIKKVKTYDYGNFAWVEDPEGNTIEFYEPS